MGVTICSECYGRGYDRTGGQCWLCAGSGVRGFIPTPGKCGACGSDVGRDAICACGYGGSVRYVPGRGIVHRDAGGREVAA